MEYASWPRGAAEHPDAERLVAALLQELRQDLALEHVERVRVAEETGHADQRVGVERVELLGVAAQELGVALERVVLGEHHAPADAALDGAGLVEREVHAGVVAEQEQDLLEPVLGRRRPLRPRSASARARSLPSRRPAAARRQRRVVVLVRRRGRAVVFRRWRAAGPARDMRVLRDASELVRDVLRREHEVHAARGHGAARHRVVARGIVLRERDAALGLDRLQPQRAVGRRAGEDHADGPLALVLRQRLEERIDRTVRGARRRARAGASTRPRTMPRFVLGGMT